MKKNKCSYFLLLTAFLLLSGCSMYSEPISSEPLCLTQTDKTAAMVAAEQVLSEMSFTIEKFDTDAGYIRTRPLYGAQLPQFWRSDNVGAFNTTEANIHSILRTVTLQFSDDQPEYCINCNVDVRRLSIPEKQIEGYSRAAESFTDGDTVIQRLKIEPEFQQEMAWIDLGCDPLLENRILRRIDRKLKNGGAD